MARYRVHVKNAAGQVKSGVIDAPDEMEAKTRFTAKNLTLIKIEPVDSKKPAAGGAGFSMDFGGRVSSKDLQIFTRQFSTLINAGIPVVDSLKLLGEGKRNPLLKEAAQKVRTSIEQGKRLGDAMGTMPKIFDRFYVNMVRAGEEAGILDGILMRLSMYLEKSEKLKKQVKGALFYPGAIIAISIVVISGILVFVIPKFQDLYKGAGKELPMITQLVVTLSQTMIHKWYLVLLILVGTPFLIAWWYRTPEGKEAMDRILIRTPLFGELIQKSSVAKLTRTLSTLLSSGVSVMEALDIAAKTAGNAVIEEALVRSKESVMSGRPLAAPLAKEPMIPDMVTQMIAIGEQSGTLDTMLGKIADFYEDDVENAVKALTSMIEPLLMIFLGGTIAVLVLAMYLPIFDMANVVTGGGK